MRIAQVAPLYEAVPPRLYGGTERIVAHPHGRAGRSRPRGDAVRQRRGTRPRPSWSPAATRRSGSTRAPLKSDLAAHLAMLHEVHRRRRRVRRHPFSRRHDPFPVLRANSRTHGDHAAWPAGPEGPAGGLRALAGFSPGLDLERPTPAAAGCQLGRDHRSTGCRRDLTASRPSPRTAISRSSGASRRRSGPTGRSRSPAVPACA